MKENRRIVEIKKEYLSNININDKFFDSLKKDYNNFENWFKKKANYEAFITRNNKGDITSFLLLKEEDETENYEKLTEPLMPAKRIKISTFKVESSGYNIGKKFLKIVNDEAKKRCAKEIYITIYPKYQKLIELLEEDGFNYKTTTKDTIKENVYIKKVK